jgi:hypothetical protein
MTAGDLRLELTLAATSDAFVGAAARTWRVDDVELCIEFVELASDVRRMVSQANASAYVLSFESFANYSSSLE